MLEFVLLFISAVLVNNFILSRFLGICPFLGVSDSIENANGMGIAVVFVITLASLITWVVYEFILVPLGIEYMRTLAFILVIAVLVQLVEMFLMKGMPTLYRALGVYLPLITTNCAVLGVAILNIDNGYGIGKSVVNGAGAAVGFWLAIVLFAAIRERLALSDVPSWLKGFPLALLTAGLMSIAFLGFAGLIR